MFAAALLTDARLAYLRESGTAVFKSGEPGFVIMPEDDMPLPCSTGWLLNLVWYNGAVSGTLELATALDGSDDS